MSQPPLSRILEAALLSSNKPLNLERIKDLFEPEQLPANDALRAALAELADSYADSAMQLVEVASGWRLQVRNEFMPWVSRLWEERPQRYSRALLETLALIAYRQPITRGEIEDIRGVAVSSHIVRTLVDREWVRVVGHRDVPGRPAMYATTRQFLDYFSLHSLNELPPLATIRDLDAEPELDLQDTGSDEETQAPATPWMPVEPLQPLDGEAAEEDFHALLDELRGMEERIKTDFDDLPAREEPTDDEPPGE
ncbi:SMC-Scp complex subunit ScpB [Halopseudomonas salegens]|uniref:Condensin subunit ScpB n=1 Tax=Halopseudomonas salegens TaxID=1434072 RepID=A0A1H2G630_9GAMM|nr:SMC-Scp complex subunit ScpB [Halopseudomonas salegens]SDU15057.1 condensin subunit ScpB [Halopseudomonas salegens]